MVEHLWLLGLVLVLFAVDTVVTYHLYRLRKQGTTTSISTKDGDTKLVDPENDTVECPDCGVENEQGYRYCHSCVSELPGAVYVERSTNNPFVRFTN